MDERSSYTLLTPDERKTLREYVEANPSEAPYQRRAQILLLADEGSSQEAIAAALTVPIVNVRQILRAYNRQKLQMFPRTVLSPPPYSPDTPIAEAGRKVMSDLVVKQQGYLDDLETTTTVQAVHEMRKTTRRLRTALKIFSPFFEDGLLYRFDQVFDNFMDRLGPSRDSAVFLYKLDIYLVNELEHGNLSDQEQRNLNAISDYWEGRKETADEKVRDYLKTGEFQEFLAEFDTFVNSKGVGVSTRQKDVEPYRTKHVAPVLIGKRFAKARAFDEYIAEADPRTLHKLRIQLKKLRYSLEFFEPVLGMSIVTGIETIKQLLTHLGDLNDARIHLQMLEEIDKGGLEDGVSLYREVKNEELADLVSSFPAKWSNFDNATWRHELLEAVALL
jgi:CHAD domain-containing protein